MRKLTTTIIIGGLMLAGCTTETIVREVPATDADRPPATSPARTAEDDFLDFVNGIAPTAVYWDDRDLLEMGYLVCEALDSGATVAEVAEVLEQSSITQGDIDLYAAVMYAAVQEFCPRYAAALEAWAGSI